MKTRFKEEGVLRRFHVEQGLKRSFKRHEVLTAFLKTEDHIDAQGLYEILQKEGRRIGYSTVWRTLKLLARAGLAREVEFGDGRTRFEHLYAHPHHDHLICLGCSRIIEFLEPGIERLQTQTARRHHFEAKYHNLIIYGWCEECRTRKGEKG